MFTQSLGGGFMLLSPENWRAAKPFLNSCVTAEVEVKLSGVSYTNINCGSGGHVLAKTTLKPTTIYKTNV